MNFDDFLCVQCLCEEENTARVWELTLLTCCTHTARLSTDISKHFNFFSAVSDSLNFVVLVVVLVVVVVVVVGQGSYCICVKHINV